MLLFHKVALWTQTFTASLSALSSSLIIFMMWSDREFRLKDKPNNRILLCMSVIDVLQSIAYAFHSAPLPASSGVFHAIGNNSTCTTQGFFIQLGTAVPAYNASLCIWYFMTIKYNMLPEYFAQKVEPYCHACSIFLPLSSACIIAASGYFTGRGYVCWIGDGLRFSWYFIALTIVQLSISFIVILYCLARVYGAIYQLELQMRRYSTSPSGMQWTSNNSMNALGTVKKNMAMQTSLFSFAFFITFLFPSINTIFYSPVEISPAKIPLLLPQSIFLPLQGMYIYVCMMYVRLCSKNYENSLRRMNFNSCFPLFINILF